MTDLRAASSAGEPNLFTVHGDHLAVTLALTGIDGRPRLTYQDPHHALSFTGDEITLESAAPGRLATVTTVKTVDVGYTTFTLLIPAVNTSSGKHPVSTIGITTVHRTSIGGIGTGQLTSYHVSQLQGTAQQVDTL